MFCIAGSIITMHTKVHYFTGVSYISKLKAVISNIMFELVFVTINCAQINILLRYYCSIVKLKKNQGDQFTDEHNMYKEGKNIIILLYFKKLVKHLNVHFLLLFLFCYVYSC